MQWHWPLQRSSRSIIYTQNFIYKEWLISDVQLHSPSQLTILLKQISIGLWYCALVTGATVVQLNKFQSMNQGG